MGSPSSSCPPNQTLTRAVLWSGQCLVTCECAYSSMCHCFFPPWILSSINDRNTVSQLNVQASYPLFESSLKHASSITSKAFIVFMFIFVSQLCVLRTVITNLHSQEYIAFLFVSGSFCAFTHVHNMVHVDFNWTSFYPRNFQSMLFIPNYI